MGRGGKAKNLKGLKFGRLLAVKHLGSNKHKRAVWLCRCDCGNTKNVTSNQLLKENGTKSCGCIHSEVMSEIRTTHGMSDTKIFRSWAAAKQRCTNSNVTKYSYYGGRGIKMCDRWLNSFENFYEDMKNNYEDGLELDRIDPDGNYEPSNCRWVTRKQQVLNRKKRKKTSSQYVGVSFHKATGKWMARITEDGVRTHLGLFEDELDAAKAYNEKGFEIYGEDFRGSDIDE